MAELELAMTAREQHDRFVRRVRGTGVVWGLRSAAGWSQSQSHDHDGRAVMPFWSDRAYAARCATGEWAGYEPTEIALADFLGAWLPGLQRDGYVVGTNWNGHLVGLEIEPSVLLREMMVNEAES